MLKFQSKTLIITRINTQLSTQTITQAMQIITAFTSAHLDEIRTIFREYEQFLNVDLCFQGFEEELANLPGKYAPPEGALLLAVEENSVAGCVAVRALEGDVCEMKRLYTRPSYRGRGLGRQLAEKIISEAKNLKYKLMRLDTLESLTAAMALYRSLGFTKTGAYYHNPLQNVIYWELPLG